MQIIFGGKRVQVWELGLPDLNIGKWSTGRLPLTRAPLGYFYNAPHALGGGGGSLFRAPPL